MRKIVLLLTLFIGLNSYAQDASQQRKNEVMISPLNLLFETFNVSYERLLNEDTGLGVNLITSFRGNSGNEGLISYTQFSPYFRYYAGKKYASGFFVEAFLPITTYKSNEYYSYSTYNNDYGYYVYNSGYKETSQTSLGLGFGLGGKWITKRNILFEASLGIARLFGDEELPVTGKLMLGIGYRF